MEQAHKNQRNSTENNQKNLKRFQSITKFYTVITLFEEIQGVACTIQSPTMQNLFSNIQSFLKTQQSQRYTHVPTWQGALVLVAVVGIPWCLCMGVFAARSQALAAARVEAKNLGQEEELNENTDCDNTNEEDSNEKEGNNNEKEDNSNKKEDPKASIKEVIEQQLDENAAPLHLNMRISARLKGVSNSNNNVPTRRVMSRSSSRGSSRSASPAPELQSHSSSSSLAEDQWTDILTDRKGFTELEPVPPHAMVVLSKLPAVSERLSEETLEDVHAFSDLVAKSMNSSTRSIQNPSSDNSYLETLDEEADSFDDSEEAASNIPTIMEDGTAQVVFDLLDSKATTTTGQEQ